MIKIEKDVQMPRIVKHSSEIGDVYKAMEVGDSAFFPEEEFCGGKISSTAYYYKKSCGRSFARRRVDGGYRVWRLK